jgi:hypothetical protein
VTAGAIEAGVTAQRTGKINMHVTLPGSTLVPNGATISKVDYSIAGPTMASGSVDVGGSQRIEFVVGDLLRGSGYTITISADDSAGDHCNSAPTPFTVQAGVTVQVALDLVCFVVQDASTGSDGSEAGCLQGCVPTDAASVETGAADVTSVDATSADSDPGDTGSGDSVTCVDQTNCNAFVNVNSSMFLLADQGTCTATELTLYAKTVSGQPPGACLSCAAIAGCLDDLFDASDVLRECEDAPTTTDAGAPGVSECLAALACGLGMSGSCGAFVISPAPAQGTVTDSYCGSGITTMNCTASSVATDAGTGPQGACVAQETAGFPSAFTPAQIVAAFVTPIEPAGLANQLLTCLNAQCATQCFP